MNHKHDTWGWMLAFDFFFAGMGGGMLVIAGLADLTLGEGATSILGNFLGPVGVALGAGLLILELGRPFQALRVFMNPKAILTIGAWCMTLSIGAGLILASFGIAALPWSGMVAVRKFFAVCSIFFGLIVATYPGVLLARHKGRPFWTGSGIMALFLTSSLVTGTAAHIFCDAILPAALRDLTGLLPGIAVGLLALQLILWAGYIYIKYTGGTEREALAAGRWVNGKYASGFWSGFMLAGTLLPLVMFLLPGEVTKAFAALLVLCGGLIMRNLVVYSGQDRTWLPGEENYRSRLPLGNEDFLKLLK